MIYGLFGGGARILSNTHFICIYKAIPNVRKLWKDSGA